MTNSSVISRTLFNVLWPVNLQIISFLNITGVCDGPCKPSIWEPRIWGCLGSAWPAGCCWTLSMRPHEGLQQLRHHQDNLWMFRVVAKGSNVWSGEASKQWLLVGWVRISDRPNTQSGQKFGKLHSTRRLHHLSFVMNGMYSIGFKLTWRRQRLGKNPLYEIFFSYSFFIYLVESLHIFS